MSSANNSHSSGSTSGLGNTIVGVSGALSFMGCVRESSPSPHDHHQLATGDNSLVKEPKKRRFHPLRGLRNIFRRKSRSGVELEISHNNEKDRDLMNGNRDESNIKHSAKRIEDSLSKSASELLTDKCNLQSHKQFHSERWSKKRRKSVKKTFTHLFLKRNESEGSLNLRGTPGHLSVSHDSVFPGEVPHTRPLSSSITLTSYERQQRKTSDETIQNNDNSCVGSSCQTSLRVLEQIKASIENRHHVASVECSNVSHASRECYQQEIIENYFTRGEKRERVKESSQERKREERHDNQNDKERWRTTQVHQDVVDKYRASPRADIPELESAGLNHTAAHHRISVRPKNRRLPRRNAKLTDSNTSMLSSTITTISESTDTLDSLEPVTSNNASNTSTPVEVKKVSILRKSSSRVSRTSDSFEETSQPKIPDSVASLSPDSLDLNSTGIIMDNCETDIDHEVKCVIRKPSNRISKNSRDELEISEIKTPKKQLSMSHTYLESSDILDSAFSKSSEGFHKLIENKDVVPTLGHRNFISKSTDGFNTLPEQLEVKPMPRKITSKSSYTVDSIDELRDPSLTPGQHDYSNQLTNITHTVSKSSDNLKAEETLVCNDSIELRDRVEIRPSRFIKAMSRSMSMFSENFDALERSQERLLGKHNSVSDFHLSGVPRNSNMTNKIISKSTENFETIANNLKEKKNITSADKHWRIPRRTNSDNLELDSHIENRKIRKISKKIHNSNVIDITCENSIYEDDKRPMILKKPMSSQFRKSSDSSELGSTDTLDSEKQNKLFDSTETIDSLEKESENDVKNEQYKNITMSTTASESESDINNANNTSNESNGDNVENTSLTSTDESYWRQRSNSKENIDIHQLLTIIKVSRMADNSNNQRNSGPFPKKKITSPPTSPIVEQEGNKLLFNNLLVNNNDEKLQNMLNGNISGVSKDTKSFKEKLIMFEKLGK